MATTEMVIIETGDMKIFWQCSNCEDIHKATAKLEKSKTCPSCDAVITKWYTQEDEYHGDI